MTEGVKNESGNDILVPQKQTETVWSPGSHA
jgi:hypothetical protein